MRSKRGFRKIEHCNAVSALRNQYEKLVFDNALSPDYIDGFEKRLAMCLNSRLNPDIFIEQETATFEDLVKRVDVMQREKRTRNEVRKRVNSGQTAADRVLAKYSDRIRNYPELKVHPNADSEICRLFGGMRELDNLHWKTLESFLRKAYPQAGHVDRLSVEERFWRFVATRQDRLPEALERYSRALSLPSSSRNERIYEAQTCIKQVAFFLHDLLDICVQASTRTEISMETRQAIDFVEKMILDFRVSELRQR